MCRIPFCNYGVEDAEVVGLGEVFEDEISWERVTGGYILAEGVVCVDPVVLIRY